MKEIVIYDANIFIDVINMELQDVLSCADYLIHTTSLVANEIIRPEQKAALSKLKISVYRYDSLDQYKELSVFKESIRPKRNLSFSDFSVLKLALDKSAPLFTTDAKLRRVAKVHGLEVHGSLGLVIELNRAKLLTRQEAVNAIIKLQNTNSRISESIVNEALSYLE